MLDEILHNPPAVVKGSATDFIEWVPVTLPSARVLPLLAQFVARHGGALRVEDGRVSIIATPAALEAMRREAAERAARGGPR
mgnify:CR=1 FL=1